MNVLFRRVDESKTDLVGPYECSYCGGHVAFDFTFIEQVETEMFCPYCGNKGIEED